MKTQTYPRAGDRVRGTHIFGNKYTGIITEARPHSIETARTVCFIRFDAPTDLGCSPKIKTGDVREAICTEVYPPAFAGDKAVAIGLRRQFRDPAMKTALEIHRKLAGLLCDQRMSYPTATITINAPLALRHETRAHISSERFVALNEPINAALDAISKAEGRT